MRNCLPAPVGHAFFPSLLGCAALRSVDAAHRVCRQYGAIYPWLARGRLKKLHSRLGFEDLPDTDS